MRQQLIDLLAVTVWFLVVFTTILYAYYTGWWTDVIGAHAIAIGVIVLDEIDRKKAKK